jgi:aryl-alcohol dehydrogenase-like predicted oxidoreductase
MDYRPLGTSGLQISALTLGTMTFGGQDGFEKVGSTDVAGAKRQIDMCLDVGVNLIDTADIYSGGRAEEIIGEALEGKRDDVLLASKVRMRMGDGPNDEGLSRHHIISGCEASLRRLRTDHLDLYTAWQLMKALGIAERDRLPRFCAQQIYYSLQERSAEYELIPLALDQGLGTLVWSPLAGGLLSGKYRRGQEDPEGTRKLGGWDEPPVYDEDALYDTIDVLVEVAEARGVSAAQVALAWLLGRPTVSSVIVGARTDEQLADNLKAAELSLSDDERARLEEVSRPPLLYPYWHQHKTALERLSPADLTLLGQYPA